MQLVRVGGQQIALLSKQELFERKGAIRFLVFWRDGFRCVYCGQSRFEDRVWLNIDHVIPERAGGEYTFENLVTACAACNFGKGRHQLPRDVLERMAEATKVNSRTFAQLTRITIPSLVYKGEIRDLSEVIDYEGIEYG